MAKIVISSTGTHGDHLPYIVLGEALQKRGHQVCLAFRESMHPFVLKAGLESAVCGTELNEAQARRNASDWDVFQPTERTLTLELERLKRELREDLPMIFQQLLAACENADLFIAGFQRQLYGAMLEKKIGLPWVTASVTPSFQCAEQPEEDSSVKDRSLFNYLYPTVKATFEKLNIPELDWETCQDNERAILASSSHFSQPNTENRHYQPTGFFFYEDPAWQTWQPDPALEKFIETHPKPLFLTFSSIPVVDPRAVLAVHSRAAKKLGKGLLVQRGRANFNESLIPNDVDPQSIFFVDFMSQDWLLKRTSVIIHHGGIGTIARALRNDCPMVIEPLGNDQFFNAKRVLKLKIGTAIHPRRVTPDGLAKVLENKIFTTETQNHVHNLGEKIRAESSEENACDLIESWL